METESPMPPLYVVTRENGEEETVPVCVVEIGRGESYHPYKKWVASLRDLMYEYDSYLMHGYGDTKKEALLELKRELEEAITKYCSTCYTVGLLVVRHHLGEIGPPRERPMTVDKFVNLLCPVYADYPEVQE